MPGDVGLVAKLLSEVFGFIVDPDGYKQLARENKLLLLMRGINAAIKAADWARADMLFAEYRELRGQTGV